MYRLLDSSSASTAVTGEEVDDAAVRAGIDEAGYELAGS
jgi:hypothetical protein